MTFKRAIVTAVAPLRIILDGDTVAVPFTPESLIDPATLAVDDVVRTELSGNRLVVLGRVGGLVIPTADDFIPAGIIWEFSGTALPTGWSWADGGLSNRTNDARLFTAIGTTYGAGDGSTTFNRPNRKGRVGVGVDAGQTEFDTLGETGGAKTHAHPLSGAGVAQVYPETNGVGMNWASDSGDDWTTSHIITGGSRTGTAAARSGGSALSGDTDAASTLQPYIALNYIIKG